MLQHKTDLGFVPLYPNPTPNSWELQHTFIVTHVHGRLMARVYIHTMNCAYSLVIDDIYDVPAILAQAELKPKCLQISPLASLAPSLPI